MQNRTFGNRDRISKLRRKRPRLRGATPRAAVEDRQQLYFPHGRAAAVPCIARDAGMKNRRPCFARTKPSMHGHHETRGAGGNMSQGADAELLALYDDAPLSGRFWATLALVYAQAAFEFFDYFLVSYLVAVLAPSWQLTYGQSSIMLLSAGVGAIIGSLVWGRLVDIFGRKKLLVIGTCLYPLAAGSIALLPDGAWMAFSALRFLVGVGMAGAITAQIPLLVEITPTRHRPVVTGGMVVPVSLGVLLAALSAATLLEHIGWRGIAALGAAPIVAGLAIAAVVPESVRWLLVHGRFQEARAIVAHLLRRPEEEIVLPSTLPVQKPNAPFRDLYRNKVRFWQTAFLWTALTTVGYCAILWGPTILSLRLNIPVKAAAEYFVYVSLAAIAGRILFTFLPLWTGRRRAGELAGYVGAAFLLGAGIFNGLYRLDSGLSPAANLRDVRVRRQFIERGALFG
jgi:putative MFS transporter